jgi:hypothetical protein
MLAVDKTWRLVLNIPVRECVGAEINIVVRSCGAINLDRSNDTISVLTREVRVIPAGSIFSGLENIVFGVSWSDSTCRHVSKDSAGLKIEVRHVHSVIPLTPSSLFEFN